MGNYNSRDNLDVLQCDRDSKLPKHNNILSRPNDNIPYIHYNISHGKPQKDRFIKIKINISVC